MGRHEKRNMNYDKFVIFEDRAYISEWFSMAEEYLKL